MNITKNITKNYARFVSDYELCTSIVDKHYELVFEMLENHRLPDYHDPRYFDYLEAIDYACEAIELRTKHPIYYRMYLRASKTA